MFPILLCSTNSGKHQENATFLHSSLKGLFLILFLLVLFSLPYILSIRFVGVFTIMAILVVATVGLQITTGYAGQVNLGQSAFMGMGAYTTASLASHFGFPLWITIPIGGGGAAILGAIFGLPALRIKGFYLALTTIAAQTLFPIIIVRAPKKWFGGPIGIDVEPGKFFGITINTETTLYYLVIITTVIMVYAAFNLMKCRVGRAFVAIRENEIVAEIMGINVYWYKTLSFLVGAFYAGIAGGLWAYYFRYLMVDQFTLWFSIWYLGMLIVGGMGSILGAILGTVLIRALQEMITYLGPYLTKLFPGLGESIWFMGMNILLGGIIILFLIFEPKGLVHRWNLLVTSRIWPFRISKIREGD
jgi:branched-chain amino acid transport system permease protein